MLSDPLLADVAPDVPRSDATPSRSRVRAWARRWARAAPALAVTAVFVGFAIDRRWIDDDGFINLRIVRNVVLGYGPVYNVGERLEAATSPLWLAILCAARACGLAATYAAVVLGIALATAGLLAAQAGALRLGSALARDRRRSDGDEMAATSRGFVAVPFGAIVVACVVPFADYASSGLETGLAVGWLGLTYLAIVRRITRSLSSRGTRATLGAIAALAGLGPLVRPELALEAAAFVAILVVDACVRSRAARPAARVRAVLAIAAAAAAAPAAYEIFRMGYFAMLTPSTALAKEAFRANLTQGLCYARNFFGTYALGIPLVFGVPLAATLLRDAVRARTAPLAAAIALPIVAALAHGAYVVAMGGDYMHARMFLPVVFAALLPISAIAVGVPAAPTRRGALTAFLRRTPVVLVAAIAWGPIAAISLRAPKENVCEIGDERTWYAAEAGVARPITLADYAGHPFVVEGHRLRAKVDAACAADGRGDACRLLVVDPHDPHDKSIPLAVHATYRLSDDVDPRVRAVAPLWAIGAAGYAAPPSLRVADRHGIADPLGARVEIGARRRPGHEKQLGLAWLIARYAAPSALDDGPVVAARRALACEPLASYLRGITAPMGPRLFAENLVHAWTNQNLRIPADPYDAEARFCGTPAIDRRTAGGSGGVPFTWGCGAGARVTGIDGAIDDEKHAIAGVHALCTDEAAAERPERSARAAPFVGRDTAHRFALHCPDGGAVVGLTGAADQLIRTLGVVCRDARGVTSPGDIVRASPPGAPTDGAPFDLACGAPIVALTGRAGDLIDAIGVACAPRS